MACSNPPAKDPETSGPLVGNSLFLRVGRALGDSMLSTAVIEGIGKRYPDIRIFVLAKYRELFANNPHVVACHDVRRTREKNPSLYKRFVALGYRTYPDFRVAANKRHIIDDMYDKIPLAISERCYRPRIYLTEQERNRYARRLERLARPLVAISPFGNQKSCLSNKIYPYKQWEEAVQRLLQAGVNIVQVGRKTEGPLLAGAHAWRDIGYRYTAAVLLHCDAVITHVGGIMHLATAVSVPCVALFAGVEDPCVSGYKENLNLFIPLECSPCWLEEPCATRQCMSLLSPEKIVQETLNLIKPCSHVKRTCSISKER